MSLFFEYVFVPFPLSLCMESTSYVLSFRMVFFYLVTSGWIFDISLCKNLIRKSIMMCFLCFLPIHSGHQVRWTYQPGSHRIFHPPSFCGACLNFSREEELAIPFPRRPWSRILCTNDLIVLHSLGIYFYYFLFFCERNPVYPDRTHVPTCLTEIELTSQRVRSLGGYL